MLTWAGTHFPIRKRRDSCIERASPATALDHKDKYTRNLHMHMAILCFASPMAVFCHGHIYQTFVRVERTRVSIESIGNETHYVHEGPPGLGS
jgi:hypothetical protein